MWILIYKVIGSSTSPYRETVNAYSDEMLQNVAFYQCLHHLLK